MTTRRVHAEARSRAITFAPAIFASVLVVVAIAWCARAHAATAGPASVTVFATIAHFCIVSAAQYPSSGSSTDTVAAAVTYN